MIQMNSLMEYLKRMDPQKRTVFLMLFIIILFHFLVIPLWMWNLGLWAFLVGDQWTGSVFVASLVILIKADPLQWDGANDRKSFFQEI